MVEVEGDQTLQKTDAPTPADEIFSPEQVEAQYIKWNNVQIGTSGLREAIQTALQQHVNEEKYRRHRVATVFECLAVQKEVLGHFVDRGANEKQAFNLRLLLEEALMNGLKHGVQEVEDTDGYVTVTWGERDGMIECFIEDTGPGFDPSRVPNPIHPDNLEANHGRGMWLLDQMNLPQLQGETTYLPSNGGETCNKMHILVPIKLDQQS